MSNVSMLYIYIIAISFSLAQMLLLFLKKHTMNRCLPLLQTGKSHPRSTSVCFAPPKSMKPWLKSSRPRALGDAGLGRGAQRHGGARQHPGSRRLASASSCPFNPWIQPPAK